MNFRPEDLPYFEDLRKIREFLEREVADFPDKGCFESSSLVKEFTGLPMQGGVFHNLGYSHPHLCNYDPKRKIFVDLSLDQFDIPSEKIALLPELNPWFLPTQEYNRLEDWQILSPRGYLPSLFRRYETERKMQPKQVEPQFK